MNILFSYRFLISRRFIQLVLIVLFAGGNYLGWTVLKGNFSAGLLFKSIPLTDPYALLQIFASGFVASGDLILGALIVLFIYGLITGRMFCSWICPMNIVTDAAIYANSKIKIKQSLEFSNKTRYGVLVLGIILSAILGYSAFEAINPISILHRGIIFGMGAGWAIILAIFLLDLSVIKNGWCGHLCPLGAFYSIISRYSLIKVKHKKESCTNCMKCFEVCPEVQVLDIIGKESGYIKSGECTNCARCIEVCDDKALKFALRTTKTTKKQDS